MPQSRPSPPAETPRAAPLASLAKAAAFALLFSFLHFLHDWLPNPAVALVSGTGESVFQHMKVGLYAWVSASLVELALARFRAGRRGAAPPALRAFLASRALGAALAPWLILVSWYALAGLAGPMPSAGLEVLSAFGLVLLAGWAASLLERPLAAVAWEGPALVAVLAAFGVTVLFFALYADSRPWVDLFAEPVVAY